MLNSIEFENNISDIIQEGTKGASYKAFYDTFFKTNPDIPERVKSVMDRAIKDDAEKFSNSFSDYLAKDISSKLTKLITEYIKSMDIYIIHTPTSLTSPMGPVSGVLTINNQNSSILIK